MPLTEIEIITSMYIQITCLPPASGGWARRTWPGCSQLLATPGQVKKWTESGQKMNRVHLICMAGNSFRSLVTWPQRKSTDEEQKLGKNAIMIFQYLLLVIKQNEGRASQVLISFCFILKHSLNNNPRLKQEQGNRRIYTCILTNTTGIA